MSTIEKARKLAQRHIADINAANDRSIRQRIDAILNFKEQKLKHVNTNVTYSAYTVHLHGETHHFAHTVKHVLDEMMRIQNTHPYVKLWFRKDADLKCVDVRENRKQKAKRKLTRAIKPTTASWCTLNVYVYWDEYMNELNGTRNDMSTLLGRYDYNGVQDLLKKINEHNDTKIRTKLDTLLKDKKSALCETNDSTSVLLHKNTFKNAYSRQAFLQLCNDIRSKMPFVEIYNVVGRRVWIRVWWKIYFHPPDAETTHASKQTIRDRIRLGIRSSTSSYTPLETSYPPVPVEAPTAPPTSPVMYNSMYPAI